MNNFTRFYMICLSLCNGYMYMHVHVFQSFFLSKFIFFFDTVNAYTKQIYKCTQENVFVPGIRCMYRFQAYYIITFVFKHVKHFNTYTHTQSFKTNH